jgi:hypothetical protein
VVWEICGVTTVVLYLVVLVPVPAKPGVGFVGWEPHSGRGQSCFSFYRPGGANLF